jgi:hypothetical protein
MTRKVFIANFGQENYEWPVCLERATVATMNEISGQKFWEAGDREGYIQSRLKEKTAAGLTPTRPVASRWFNLMTIIAETAGDIWIHREKGQLWWTTSKTEQAYFLERVEPVGRKRDVIVCHKPCEPWSDRNLKGNRLDWNSLHPKAKEFLFTESTLQQLGSENAEYALALIAGENLSPWHSRSEWKKKAQSHAEGKIFNPRQRAAAIMVMTAMGTVSQSNGQQVLKTVKNKEMLFPDRKAFEKCVLDLLELQEGLCAITDLRLQYEGDHDDIEMVCSLDRIDSDKHYEPGNLQIVCRFVNRWKSNGKDEEFRRLIRVVQAVEVS